MSASVEEFIEVLNAEQYIDLRKLQDYARHGCKPSVRGETWLYLLGVLSSDKSQEMTSVRSQYLFYEQMDKSIPHLDKSIRHESTRYYKRRLVSRTPLGRTLARSALRIHETSRRRAARVAGMGNGAGYDAVTGAAEGSSRNFATMQDQGPNRVDSDQATTLAGIMGRSGQEEVLDRNPDHIREGADLNLSSTTSSSSGGRHVDEDPEVASANEMKRFNVAIRNIVCAYLNKGKREAQATRDKREAGGAGLKGKSGAGRRERSVVGFLDDASSEEERLGGVSSGRQRRATSSGSSVGSITAASLAAASANARLRGLGVGLGLPNDVTEGGDGGGSKGLDVYGAQTAIAPDWAYPQTDVPLGAGPGGEDVDEEDHVDEARLSRVEGEGKGGEEEEEGAVDEEGLNRQGTSSPHPSANRGRLGGLLDEERSNGGQGGSKGWPGEACGGGGGGGGPAGSEIALEPDLIAMAAPFVKCIRVEAGMYFAFDRLMGMIEEHYSRRPLPECVSDFLTLFRTTLPDLYAYFEEEEVDVVGFASAWLRHLLAAEMRIEDLLLLWDSYFSMPDPLELHMYVCIAILANCKDALEELDQSEANSMLLSLPPLDVDRIINEATNIKLSHRQSQMEG